MTPSNLDSIRTDAIKTNYFSIDELGQIQEEALRSSLCGIHENNPNEQCRKVFAPQQGGAGYSQMSVSNGENEEIQTKSQQYTCEQEDFTVLYTKILWKNDPESNH
eukprot:15364995-Ditylum_brightwellii.AAC.2